jgi:hypothetical protein
MRHPTPTLFPHRWRQRWLVALSSVATSHARTAVGFLSFYAAHCLAGDPPGPLYNVQFFGEQAVRSVGQFWSIWGFTPSGTPPFTWQWYFEGHPIPGATRNQLSIFHVASTNGGRYGLVISNAFGSATNQTFFLTVVDPSTEVSAGWWAVSDPRIRITANIQASPAARIQVQWLKSGQEIAGATNRLLDVPFEFNKEVDYGISVRAHTGINVGANQWFPVVASIPAIQRVDNLNLKYNHPGLWPTLEEPTERPTKLQWSTNMVNWIDSRGMPAQNKVVFLRAIPCCMPYPEQP